MYTTFVYYPSPIDGNLYPIYIFLEGGNLSPIHFVYFNNTLSLGYYPNVGWNKIATEPISVNYVIKNKISNLVYYQPNSYGQVELLYCAVQENMDMLLYSNPTPQQFEAVLLQSNSLQILENNNPGRIGLEIQPNVPRLPVHSNRNIPNEILESLQALQYGKLSDVSINSNQHGFRITAEDLSGNRIVIEKYENNGVSKKSVTEIKTSALKKNRQIQVVQLRKEGFSQTQIANHLGVSQKTISNDLREINN